LNLLKSSLQDELDAFFQHVNQTEFEKRVITKSALTQARRFLSYKAFNELSEHFVEPFYTHSKTKKWNGYRLQAVDGSTLRLHGADELKEHFGGQKNGDDIIPMARLSSFFLYG